MPHIFQASVGDKPLIMEMGKLANQAGASVLIHYGDTILLTTACRSQAPRAGANFLPLTIDYEERHYAVGRIPGSFFRREGRPSQDATLAARLTDRPLRPLFPKGFYYEIQVVVTVLSADHENPPEVLAISGGSAALTLSDIPFYGPLAAVRVGYKDGEWLINPTYSQMEGSLFDVVVAGTKEKVMMLEAGAKQAPEELLVEAIKRGHQAIQPIIRLQEEMRQQLGRPKMEAQPSSSAELQAAVASFLRGRLDEAWSGSQLSSDVADRLRQELAANLGNHFPPPELGAAFEAYFKDWMRQRILEKGQRPDGRSFEQLRPVSAEVQVLPRAHGSALFTRGETQVLTVATLGSLEDEQQLDTLNPAESKQFIHHYNFPAYSTGEVGRMGGPGRREIGHGALAEKALLPVLPAEETFPYTIRLVSEVLSSNGSTSMASACASSLALMDAGVPTEAPVAGVAMGLVSDKNGSYALLTDIAGVEDANGDMDFKVAGTARGVTAIQLDVKIPGISYEIIEQALHRAKKARWEILEKMAQALPASRTQVSLYAPKMYKISISPDKIGYVIGSGGRTIKAIMEATKTTVHVENDGGITVGSVSDDGAKRAIRMIENLTRKLEVGEVFTGKVTRILNFGAMVEILPGKEGLVPLQELAEQRVTRADEVVKVGDEISVRVMEIDRLGRLNLSRRALLQGLPPSATPSRETQEPRGRFFRPRRPPPGGGGPRSG